MSGNNGNGHPPKPDRNWFQLLAGRIKAAFADDPTRYYTRAELETILRGELITEEFRRDIVFALELGTEEAIRALGPADAASRLDSLVTSLPVAPDGRSH